MTRALLESLLAMSDPMHIVLIDDNSKVSATGTDNLNVIDWKIVVVTRVPHSSYAKQEIIPSNEFANSLKLTRLMISYYFLGWRSRKCSGFGNSSDFNRSNDRVC